MCAVASRTPSKRPHCSSSVASPGCKIPRFPNAIGLASSTRSRTFCTIELHASGSYRATSLGGASDDASVDIATRNCVVEM